ncbi:gamma-glutamylcyclotransferase [Zobellella maritima]|uniref:gamma-glutamylcyclotransferase n=1 Tax=Zobellella maritima TaxID=2059725 RepID=UPI000E306CFC|nr:gamma-glutamylcyclotransferase [Zobellella maritima]
MNYFAYGSNMSLARLRRRVPSARSLGAYKLTGHALRFHKRGRDGSAKCDAYATGDDSDHLLGVLFDISESDKKTLDIAEGLGQGYSEKEVAVTDQNGLAVLAITYYATHIDDALAPYGWYKAHVLAGAREAGLPAAYIRQIEVVAAVVDPDRARERRELAIYR